MKISTIYRKVLFQSFHVQISVENTHINPLRAKFFRGNINIYLHFMSLLHIDMAQVLKILPQVRPGPTYSMLSISWLLMSRRCKEPGHQQPCSLNMYCDTTNIIHTPSKQCSLCDVKTSIHMKVIRFINVNISKKISIKILCFPACSIMSFSKHCFGTRKAVN